MGSFSIWHWIVVFLVVMLLFGRGRFSEMMGDVAKGIKAFKKGMAEDDTPSAATTTTTTVTTPAAAAYPANGIGERLKARQGRVAIERDAPRVPARHPFERRQEVRPRRAS